MKQLNARKIILSQPPKGGWKHGDSGVCQWCGSTFVSSTNRGQLFCSRSCSRFAMWQAKSSVERKAIAEKAAIKLRGRPSWNKGIPCRPETRAKLSAGHKAIGHCPRNRGGNGKIAPCEAMMREMLPAYWRGGFPIVTGIPRGNGYPPCYKVDFALPFKKLAIEVDGSSHTSRRSLDAKKDSFLMSRGWQVWRVSNEQVRKWFTTFKSTGLIPIQLGVS